MIRAKNYRTVTIFVKVMSRILWPLFFPDTVYIETRNYDSANSQFNHMDNKPLGNIIEIITLFHIPQCHLFFSADREMAPVTRIKSDPCRNNMWHVL